MSANKYLLWGATGWIGGQVTKLLRDNGQEVILAKSRLDDYKGCEDELEEHKPTHVINAAGITGRPNVDWCESHKVEVIRTNVIGTLALIDTCFQKDIHVTNMATGCIFEYDDEHTWGGKPFTEADDANFDGSYYSRTKGYMDRMIREYTNTLNLRIRMPISDDLNPRSLVTKISKYTKVINIPNSMTILTDLLPLVQVMAERKITGNLNFTNPGAISHNEILDLYIKYIDPEFKYTNFENIEEHNSVIVAKRSNNELSTDRLEELFPGRFPHVKVSMEEVFKRMKVNLGK